MTSGDAMRMSEMRDAGAGALVYLKGTSYPINKQKLVSRAQEAGATDTIMEVLNALEDRVYLDAVDVQREINRVTRMAAYEANRGIGPNELPPGHKQYHSPYEKR